MTWKLFEGRISWHDRRSCLSDLRWNSCLSRLFYYLEQAPRYLSRICQSPAWVTAVDVFERN